MPASRRRFRWIARRGLWLVNLVLALALGGAFALAWAERGWVTPRFPEPAQAFHEGAIGSELMPLTAALTLPSLAPQHFQPAGRDAGDWIDQFGFLRDPENPHGLPVGFVLSPYRPGTAAPSPVPFVGFSCALCHTTEFRAADDAPGRRVTGPGNVALNLFAWLDAFQAALLERAPLTPGAVFDPADPPPYRLTAADFGRAYAEAAGREMTLAETAMTALWLRQIRGRLEAGLPRFDEPHGHGRSRDVEVAATGPMRTLAFRTLLRTVMERPAVDLPIHTKIAAVFSQDRRGRAQFDGSIADLDARSALAAFAAGATAVNMADPEIAHTIRAASAYTLTLRAPAFRTVFPEAPAPAAEALERGESVYRAHCAACHGAPDGADGWTPGPRTDTVIPLAEIGTDPERVMFRHYGALAGRMHALFPPGHPFAFDRDEIFPLPGQEDDISIRGYVAGALDGAWARAPYLHNASVPTLAELIHLEPRRAVFHRGRNAYDVARVGYDAPAAPDALRYFHFDASRPGNANSGHDYPWAPDDPARDEDDLRALLSYLTTL